MASYRYTAAAAAQDHIDAREFSVLFRCGRRSCHTRRAELAQTRQHLLGEQGDVGNRVGVVEEAALAEHQQVAEAADAVVERLDLVVHIVGRTGETGAALDQLLDRRGPLVDRVAVAVAHKATALAAGSTRPLRSPPQGPISAHRNFADEGPRHDRTPSAAAPDNRGLP